MIPYQIKITPALNGYIVNVGCQTVVYTSREVLLKELDDYLQSPDTVMKAYSENAIHKELLTRNCPLDLGPIAPGRVVSVGEGQNEAPTPAAPPATAVERTY